MRQYRDMGEWGNASKIALVVGSCAGLLIWIATMASKPIHSDDWNPALWPLLALTAFGVGLFERRRPWRVALAVNAAPLLLMLWTTPRGDDDGLWSFIIPMILGFTIVLAGTAAVSGAIGRRFAHPSCA
jgi:hypothetical protein